MAGDFQACGEEAHSGTGAVIEVTIGYSWAQRGSLTQPGEGGGGRIEDTWKRSGCPIVPLLVFTWFL